MNSSDPGFFSFLIHFHRTLAIFLFLFLAGCTTEEYCRAQFQSAWGELTVGRFDDNDAPIRPTVSEEKSLRRLIRSCSDILPVFVLDDRESAIIGDATEELNILLLAIELDDPTVLEQLVSEGLSYDGLPNSYGVSSLYVATYRQAQNSFDWALQKGVDPNIADAEGLTPLAIASMQPPGDFDGVRRLLAAGAAPDLGAADGMTPLAISIWSGNLTNAMVLADAGANVKLARSLVQKRLDDTPSQEVRNRVSASLEEFDKHLVDSNDVHANKIGC